jgi:hypothetical protein
METLQSLLLLFRAKVKQAGNSFARKLVRGGTVKHRWILHRDALISGGHIWGRWSVQSYPSRFTRVKKFTV